MNNAELFIKTQYVVLAFKIDFLCLVMMLGQPKFAEDINKCKANEGATFAWMFFNFQNAFKKGKGQT